MSPRRIRAAAVCIALGLVVEWLTLHWAHPTAFLVFLGVGGLCLAAGVLICLTGLLRAHT